MKKFIEIEFPDNFIPPETFDGVEDIESSGTCEQCPFYIHDTYDPYEDCNFPGNNSLSKCPIKHYFD